MFTSTMDLDSNRREGLTLSKDNFQNIHSTFSITKQFPNNYSNVSRHIEFSPSDNPIVAEQTNGLYLKCANSKNGEYYTCAADTELRLASMRIFATIMLNAWRRRREDVKRLLLKVEDLKKGSQKAKNQIHVYNTLFRVEQKRNDELACQLKCSLESVMQAKSSCENLNTNVISLRAERVLLEQDLAIKSKELEALTDILSQTKEQLFQSMIDQHNLRFALNKEQRSVKLYQLTNESRETEDKYRTEMVRKEIDCERANGKVKLLEAKLNDLKEKSRKLDKSADNEKRLRRETESLQKTVATLQEALENTFVERFYRCWDKMRMYQYKGLHVAQMCLYCLLPAVPLPTTCPKQNNNLFSQTEDDSKTFRF
ncbi:tropomyosin isoform X2 [Bactrocera oleae]|uniref:tropomyosin isoform X2 n=1 Tax=Bactrocera oleae TaxID=104688 RepID=UPI0006B7C924